ncbi:MAG: hypothetical protein JSW11_03995 [Candidatus Heimdallarchaeota archaeon]|nr:MAG: hypothetical protein JSW11_03995 [Candidatus Heimdallarchaeota archaeon]
MIFEVTIINTFDFLNGIKMKTQAFGWQYFLISVPIGWQMIFEKKRKKRQSKNTGYFGFRDAKEKKLEVSWAKYDKNPPDLIKVIKNFFESLKKSKKEIKIRTEGERKVNDHKAKYIYWELENERIQGYIVVWICDQTQRLIICPSQFATKEKSIEKPRIMNIISQINCHPESQFSVWTAPNLQIHSPYLSMNLKKKDFLIGLTFIHLYNDELNFLAYRIGLADQKVTDIEEIPDWYKAYYKKHLPGIPSNYNPENFTKLIYKKKKVTWKNKHTLEKKIPFNLRNTHLETYLWLNLKKNDIYCIIFFTKRKIEIGIRELIEKMTKLAIEAN